jgi:hypothetical protein
VCRYFHPHIHALVTDGLIERGGQFHPLEELDTRPIEQHFRELVLARLRRAGRLSEAFQENLLSWEHSGFSVHAGERIPAASTPAEAAPLERMARYMTRAPIALGKVFQQKDGRVKLLTPLDPRTEKDYVLFDPLEWVHAVTTQIPDARQHLVRYQGAYANTKGTQTVFTEHIPPVQLGCWWGVAGIIGGKFIQRDFEPEFHLGPLDANRLQHCPEEPLLLGMLHGFPSCQNALTEVTHVPFQRVPLCRLFAA